MNLNELESLIRKYNLGNCSQEEKELLELWYHSFDWRLAEGEAGGQEIMRLREESLVAIQKKITTNDGIKIHDGQEQKKIINWQWLKYAVAASLIFVAGALFFYSKKESLPVSKVVTQSTKVREDIQAGSSRAQLTLADGSVITLDSAGASQLKEKDGTVIKNGQGLLTYNATTNEGVTLFNTIAIPRGGEYQIVLTDGTKVWINAASTLRFPTKFTGNERKVFLSGEAYFEVAKNSKMTFRVIGDNDLNVEVLGTHFNIMAYEDEDNATTTLVEGKVKVSRQKQSVMLSPSKQAVWQRKGETILVSEADVDKVIAWKNGMIEFHEDAFPYIMRQVSRWYDLDVDYNGKPPEGNYSGSIRRTASLSQVLEILKAAGVSFSLAGKKLTVNNP